VGKKVAKRVCSYRGELWSEEKDAPRLGHDLGHLPEGEKRGWGELEKKGFSDGALRSKVSLSDLSRSESKGCAE